MTAPHERAVLAVAILATVMGILEMSVVTIALPVIQRDLGTSWITAQWVMEAYILMLASLILVAGGIADRYGRRTWFGVGIGLFTVASLGCGLAPTGGWLVAMRFAQGLGAAFMVPGSLALIATHVPAERRGRAVGLWSAATAIAVAGGPALAGWVVQDLTWRLLFWLPVPFGLPALVVLFRHVPESRRGGAGRLDWLGGALITATLACLTAGLLEAGRSTPLTTLPLLPAAAVLGVAFLVSQVARRDPLLPPRLFAERTFAGVNVATLVLYSGLQAATFFLPFQLMQVHGWTPLAAGAAMLPFVIAISALSPLAGRLTDRIGATPLLLAGMATGAAGFLLMSRLAAADDWLSVLGAMVVLGCGMGFVVSPISTVALGAAGPDRVGLASAVNNTAARVGGLLSIALNGLLAVAVFRAHLDAGLPALSLAPEQTAAVHDRIDQLAALTAPDGLAAPQAAALQALVGEAFAAAFERIMWGSAVLALAAALVVAVTVRRR